MSMAEHRRFHEPAPDALTRLRRYLLAVMIRQGRDEGTFDVTHPDETAVIVAGMGLQLADALIDAFSEPAAGERRTALVRASLEALERVLGAPAGSLADLTPTIADATMLSG
ncbi:MAG: hypothetical protein GEV11_12930 [Streptosporangiales bacterium]|nr:hypothetical protein [Streptosporangiales bacterium]